MSRSTISTKEWKCGMKVRSKKRNNIINPDNILTIHELHQYADAGPNINRVTAISDTGHYMCGNPSMFICYQEDQKHETKFDAWAKLRYGGGIYKDKTSSGTITLRSHHMSYKEIMTEWTNYVESTETNRV